MAAILTKQRAPVVRSLIRLLGAFQSAFGVVALLVIWQVGVVIFKVPAIILPAPLEIAAALLKLPSGELAGHFAATANTVLLGFALSVVVSIPLAVAITSSAFISKAIYPILIITQSIPMIALAPILIVLLGAGELPRTLVTFLVAFFPLVVSTAAGLLATPPELIELGRSYRAGTMKLFWRIRLPFAVPFIFSGLKVASSLAVVGAVVAEFVAANRGLGYLITTSMAFFEPAVAWGAVLTLAMMGIAFFGAVIAVERICFPWSDSRQASERT